MMGNRRDFRFKNVATLRGGYLLGDFPEGGISGGMSSVVFPRIAAVNRQSEVPKIASGNTAVLEKRLEDTGFYSVRKNFPTI